MPKKILNQRNMTLLLASAAVLMLVILSTSIGSIQFQPGHPIAHSDSTLIQISVEKVSAQIEEIPLWKQVIFWGLVFLLVIIVASLFSPELRKKIIQYFLRFTLFVIALFYIIKNFHQLFPGISLDGMLAAGGGGVAGGDTASLVFTPPQIPPGLLYLISLFFVIGLAGLAVMTGRWWSRLIRHPEDSEPLLDLANAAHASLVDISNGRNWQDAIIECYSRMSNIIGLKRGIQRRKDLTPSEFAIRLAEVGLPEIAVRRLTLLFENARYGSRIGSTEDVDDAVACLNTILHACGVSK